MIDRLVRIAVVGASLFIVQPLLAKETPVTAPAASEAPAAKEPAARSPSTGQSAARERQKKCGAEWRALTDAQKSAQGPKWPQFWSGCNKRLKGGDKA